MIRKSLTITVTVLLTLILISASTAKVREGENKAVNAQSGLTTLYAFDPVESSLCLSDGKPGYEITNNKVFNRCSHIAFEIYQKDSLSAGIQGGDHGYIVDLGTATALKERYGYQETVGNPQGFASLHLADNKIVVLKDYKDQSYQALKEAEQLFKTDNQISSAPVQAGHIYVVRIKRDQPDADIMVKVLVLSYTPGESVVLRWVIL